MKQYIGISLIAVFFAALAGITVYAQDSSDTTITQEKIAKIRDRCGENLASLNRLHQTDTFLRTNRGDLYRTISDKLMVPLNKRLASNQLNGGELINLSADFNTEYARFYSSYIEYDTSMTRLLAIDCNRAPVTFYNALVDTRKKRDVLSKSNRELMRLVKDFGVSYEKFKIQYLKENT